MSDLLAYTFIPERKSTIDFNKPHDPETSATITVYYHIS